MAAMRVRDPMQAGQATIEFVALLPLLLGLALGAWQGLVVVQAASLGGSAAGAAARAAAVGRDPLTAARAVLPPRLERDLKVRPGDAGGVTVELRVPAVVGGGRFTTLRPRAAFAPQGR